MAEGYTLKVQTWNLNYLRNCAIQVKISRPRSLAWAIMLKALPSPDNNFISSLKQQRKNYDDLRQKFSMDPRAVLGDDPLSQKDESVWNQHFCDNELKALILQDVVRTFPDEPYFRDSGVQDLMVRVLFTWARLHPDIGYRQGMHEILAPLLLELYLDRKLAPDTSSEILNEYLKEENLESDSFILFSTIMTGLERFYSTGEVVPSACGRLPASKVVHNPNEVVRYLKKVKDEHLMPIDPAVAAHLNECNISMELFGIRWLRLLFGREFPRTEVPHLWSYLFCDGPMFPNLHCIIIAMLVALRNNLLNRDPGVVLSTLMRPTGLSALHVVALSLHLQEPLVYPRPPSPPLRETATNQEMCSLEERGTAFSELGYNEVVAEGADVARELATLALLRSQLPGAAAALSAALVRPPPAVARPLQHINQLASLLLSRNHALVDVETALEAAENQLSVKGKRNQTPVNNVSGKSHASQPNTIKFAKQPLKEVPLKVFNRSECDSRISDLPSLDPLKLRTE